MPKNTPVAPKDVCSLRDMPVYAFPFNKKASISHVNRTPTTS